jgi:HlyD family secretion protein
MPNRIFKGKVTEIGNMAILRSSGLAASQSTTSNQEAKDFKVVVALSDPPSEIRPGLSANAKITTATRNNVLAIPIQALTVRTKGDLEAEANAQNKNQDQGIAGATDIEVLSGLENGDQIVIGSYKTIRSMRDKSRVKIDNRMPVSTDSKT